MMEVDTAQSLRFKCKQVYLSYLCAGMQPTYIDIAKNLKRLRYVVSGIMIPRRSE